MAKDDRIIKKSGGVTMSYSIIEQQAIAFANNANIQLPRFQRKQTWSAVDNFKLCISVFKEYPIGVVIMNNSGRVHWLLDGRQRRNALIEMWSNPLAIYEWARAFIKFNSTCDELDLSNKYWSKIDIYLQSGNDDPESLEKDLHEADETDYDIDEEASFDAAVQSENLQMLINLIKCIHPLRKGVTRLEKMFLFNGIIQASDLDYCYSDGVGGYAVNSKFLKREINNWISYKYTSDGERFSEHLSKRYKLSTKESVSIKKYVCNNWDYFNTCFNTLAYCDAVIEKSTVGLINLNNATPLDAQNIFSLVNAGGTKLTNEELLSARPFWNETIENRQIDEYISDLYKRLEVHAPQNIVKWDLVATLIPKIDPHHFVFEDIIASGKILPMISLGFKLTSAIYNDSISSTAITSLESRELNKKINWATDIDLIAKDLNTIFTLLENNSFYFQYLRLWKKSVMSLLGSTITIEFVVVLYKRWIKDYDRTENPAAAKTIQFVKEAFYLIDRLIYEYSAKFWAGSSNTRLTKDIRNYSSRIEPVSEADWHNLLQELSTGTINNSKSTIDYSTPTLYHYYILNKIKPIFDDDIKYEIDHIYPKAIFDKCIGDASINQDFKDCLMNLCILAKRENSQKKDRMLKEINDDWLVDQIARATEIPIESFEEYSDIKNIHRLIEYRLRNFKATFCKERFNR